MQRAAIYRGLASGWNLVLIWFHWEDVELSCCECPPSTPAPCHGPPQPPPRRHGALPPCRPAVHTCLPATTTRSGYPSAHSFTKTTPAQHPQSLYSVLTWPFRTEGGLDQIFCPRFYEVWIQFILESRPVLSDSPGNSQGGTSFHHTVPSSQACCGRLLVAGRGPAEGEPQEGHATVLAQPGTDRGQASGCILWGELSVNKTVQSCKHIYCLTQILHHIKPKHYMGREPWPFIGLYSEQKEEIRKVWMILSHSPLQFKMKIEISLPD